MKYRMRRPLVCTVAFLLCCVMLKMYHHTFNLEDLKPSPFYHPPAWVRSHIRHSATPSPPVDPYLNQQNVKCSANDSTEDIPTHLPQSYQEFLRHRHCRAYPTLLTPSPCADDLYLVLAIKSTAVNAERRAAVRDTWGHAGLMKGQRVKLVFLMGRTDDKVKGQDLQPLLELESRRYGDILQWDFKDVFLNLTLKEVGFLRWFSYTCSSTHFAFKGDDDVLVNTGNLVDFLMLHKPENHLFAGYIHSPELPDRNRNSKYFVPVEIFPAEKLYPPFPSGGGYLMSRQTVLGLDAVAQRLKLFPLDDLFLGMCLHQMGENLTHHRGFLTFGLRTVTGLKLPCVYREIMLVHKLDPVEMRIMWQLMQDTLSCGSTGGTSLMDNQN